MTSHALGLDTSVVAVAMGDGKVLASGRQGDVRLMIGADGTPLVVKAFRAAYRHNSVEGARREFDALDRFHLALSQSPVGRRVTCPRPREFLPQLPGYAMSHVAGVPVNARRLPAPLPRDLSEALVEALLLFHGCTGEPYGDWQPGNVLVDGDAIALIDPTIPNRFFASPLGDTTCPSACSDLGYWLYTVAAGSLRRLVTAPRACIRDWRTAYGIWQRAFARSRDERVLARRVALAHLKNGQSGEGWRGGAIRAVAGVAIEVFAIVTKSRRPRLERGLRAARASGRH
jgi:hypothetical protein